MHIKALTQCTSKPTQCTSELSALQGGESAALARLADQLKDKDWVVQFEKVRSRCTLAALLQLRLAVS